MTVEHLRLDEARDKAVPWKQWGPYLSERQWGTVREDYSESGDAWNYFTHDQARSRAYRWGEDGLAGISDDKQRLCLALALWNGTDLILKERLFGLTNGESNHGEDVKEYYFYLDSTPTHSYLKYLYKYPQKAFPYGDLVQTSGRRGRGEFENETNTERVFGVPGRSPFVKDGINNAVVHGHAAAVNPKLEGTKAAPHYRLTVPPGECRVVRLRLGATSPEAYAVSNGSAKGPF